MFSPNCRLTKTDLSLSDIVRGHQPCCRLEMDGRMVEWSEVRVPQIVRTSPIGHQAMIA